MENGKNPIFTIKKIHVHLFPTPECTELTYPSPCACVHLLHLNAVITLDESFSSASSDPQLCHTTQVTGEEQTLNLRSTLWRDGRKHTHNNNYEDLLQSSSHIGKILWVLFFTMCSCLWKVLRIHQNCNGRHQTIRCTSCVNTS